MRRHLTYANVVSTLALCLVVGGGGAYAATQLAKNSVKTRHIAKGAVTSSDIKDRGVTLRDLAADVTGKNGEPGLKGDPGPIGPVGPIGPAGQDGAAGQNLDFDGVRMGLLTLYQPSSSTVLQLGRVGSSVAVEGRCYMDADLVKYNVILRRDAGTTGVAYVFGTTGPQGWSSLGAGGTAGLFTYTAGIDANQWAATVVESGGIFDVRGLAMRNNSTDTCTITDAYVEKVSR
jgi:hypothetical protein